MVETELEPAFGAPETGDPGVRYVRASFGGIKLHGTIIADRRLAVWNMEMHFAP